MARERSYADYKKCKTCYKFYECSKKMDAYDLQPCISYKRDDGRNDWKYKKYDNEDDDEYEDDEDSEDESTDDDIEEDNS